MRHLLVLIFISTCLTAFGQKNSNSKKQKIELTTVDFIEIRNNSEQSDTIQTTSKRFTNEEVKIFVDKWNSAKSIGPSKYITLYWIEITFKDGSKRIFRVNGKFIKEKNDWSFKLRDSDYVEQLWNNLK